LESEVASNNSDLWKNLIAFALLLLAIELGLRLFQSLKVAPSAQVKLPRKSSTNRVKNA
jgi:hypothetical protein